MKNKRLQRGSTFIEFCCVAFLVVIAALIVLDCSVCMFGAAANSLACRDAVRVAAQQSTAARAKNAAIAALKQYKHTSLSMTAPELSDAGDDFMYELYLDADGKPQVSQGPFVKVTTFSQVRLPVAVGVKETIDLKQSFTFPIMKLPE